MNDGKLILKIGADITEFKYTIEDIDARLKELYETAKTTLGKDLPKINLKIQGLERTKQELERFGSYAEGTLGSLINLKKRLEQEQLSIPVDTPAFEEAGKKIADLDTRIKNLKKTGREPIKEIIPAAAIGSIDYYNQKIKEITLQRRKISFDTEEGRQQIQQLTQLIESFENKVIEIQNTGKKAEFINPNSILGLRKRLAELENKRIRINITDEGQLAAINSEIIKINQSLQKADSISFDPQGKIQNASAKARQSLVNLGLVVQDLPFGFIAIQNNIPNLIQSFANLSQQSKEAGVSIGSQLAAQFKGTAGAILGLGLAISTLTSLTTYLIQKYGSLGEALDSIFSKTNSAAQAQKLYNEQLKEGVKNLGSEKSQIDIITRGIQNENLSRQQRLDYFYQAQKQIPELLSGLTKENILTKEGINLLKQNADARKKFLDVQGKQQATNAVLNDNYLQEFEIQKKLIPLYNQRNTIEERLANLRKTLSETDDKNRRKQIEQFLREEDSRLDSINSKIEKLKQNESSLVDVQLQYNDQLEETIIATGQYTQRNENLNESLKNLTDNQKSSSDALSKYLEALKKFNQLEIKLPIERGTEVEELDKKIKKLKEYGDILLDTTKYDFERLAALKEIQLIDKERFANLSLETKELDNVKKSIERYIRELSNLREIKKVLAKDIDITKVLKEINTQIFKDTRKLDAGIAPIIEFEFDDKRFEKIIESMKKLKMDGIPEAAAFKEGILRELLSKDLDGIPVTHELIVQTLLDAYSRLESGIAGVEITGLLEKSSTQLNGLQELYDSTFSKIAERNKMIKNSVQQFLYQPLENLFDILLTKGKKSWKEFGDAIIATLKRIAAQLIASSIASGIANLLAPGLGGISTRALGEYLFDVGELSSIKPGELAIQGAVTLQIRGNDLVGSINRTNTTIARVG